MFRKVMVYALGVAGIIVGSAGLVSAKSVAALTGTARLGSQVNCFNFDFDTGAVTSTCNADFEVPLAIDTAGAHQSIFGAKASAEGAACRVVAASHIGTMVSASPFQPIPVRSTLAGVPTGSATMPTNGVFFLDCITNSGTSIGGVTYF